MKARLESLLRNAVLAAGLAASFDAAAVYVDGSGQGQVLIYPYYSAQSVAGNPFNTYLSLVNRAPDSKVLRVRFREGRSAREVGSFNLYLGPMDTWTAAIVPSGEGARLVTYDRWCVNGPFVEVSGPAPMRYYDFTNAAYAGANADGLGTGLDRTREGYLEVFEMATLSGASAARLQAVNGQDCTSFQGATVALETAPPTGGLSGTLTVINVAKGMDFTANATALAQVADRPYYRDIGDPYPDYDAQEVTKVSLFGSGGKMIRATWSRGVDAIASVLMASGFANETVLDAATRSATDWVMTMPLQRFYLADADRPKTYPPSSYAGVVFSMMWSERASGRGAAYDNGSAMGANLPKFLMTLPWATTVMSFGTGSATQWPLMDNALSESRALGSRNAVLMTLPSPLGTGGGSMVLIMDSALACQGTYVGIADGSVGSVAGSLTAMPAVGFMVRTLENDTLDCAGSTCQGNYGGSFPHAGTMPFLFNP